MALRWVACAVALCSSAPSQAAADGDGATRGRLIYEQGRLADGRAVAARRPGAGALPAGAVACVMCHRPSGLGGTEGGVRVPPVAGAVLFAPGRAPTDDPRLPRRWLRHQVRSAYTPAQLARAITQGLDADGRVLSAAMPRYALDAGALGDLMADLRQRGLAPAAGLQDGTLHLATVITPQANAARREAVVQAMQQWSAAMAYGAIRVAWRPWTLTGPPEDWAAQLRRHWQDQPVYALLSGAGGDEWSPVAQWCETQGLPCLFPVLDRVPPATQRHWSVYLSGGVEAEARLLANRLQDAGTAPPPIVQWHSGASGRAAAQALRQALAGVQEVPEGAGFDPAAEAGVTSPSADPPALVVLWLPPDQVLAWLQRHRPEQVLKVMLSAQLAPPQALDIPPVWRRQVLWLSLRSDPLRQAAGNALSLLPWAQRLQLPQGLDPQALGDVHAATFFFGDALAQARGALNPDHLLERLEVAVDRRPAGAGWFRLSLGPGQRIAAQGGHLLGFSPPDHAQLAPLPGFIRAED